MTRAYDKIYLDDACTTLGEAMDYAANSLCIGMDVFLDMFIASGLAEQFGNGSAKVVSGLSGTELVYEVIARSGTPTDYPGPRITDSYSQEFWCGWILAYYQWCTGSSFRAIHRSVKMGDIERLYPTHHETSERETVAELDKLMRKKKAPSRLQAQRKICGYSQRVLAEKSGVNLRTLQQYELRAKDINKAAGGTLIALTKALGCRMDDLLEYDAVH